MRRKLVLTALATAAVVAAVTSVAGAGTASTEMKSPTLKLQKSQYGQILFAGNGRVLYSFTRDRRGKPSTCYDSCAAAWPVYFAPKGVLSVGAGLDKSKLGTTKRKNGRLQVTYNGWPLYYYAHESAGQVKCQGAETHGGLWLVMRANGKPVQAQ
jgi:predicted lipoprotein with Yx(FWY)xxD motif